MPLMSDTQRWGSLAKLFHWTIVLLILAQGVIGLVMVELPKKPNIIPIYTFHKSLGLTVLALALLRLIWRLFDTRPAEPSAMPRWQVLGARFGHLLLYVLLFAVPLSGWWFDSASSLRPLYWWGLVKMPSLTGGSADKALKELAQETHEMLFWVLVLVAAGHAAMALVHHFYNRDDVLRRMLPGRAPVRSS